MGVKTQKAYKCNRCGRTFTKYTPRKGCYCPECVRAKNIEYLSKYNSRMRCAKLVQTETIRSAKKKPDGTSAARWRCELRRRRDPDGYENYGMIAR